MAPQYLTEQDLQDYGTDLINLTQRSALHAVAPELQEIRQQNANLQQQLAREARRNLDLAVERAIPNFREVDRDPRWHQWLMGVDTLTGRPRQVLLNDAVASTDAGRVSAFFKKFQQEVGAVQAQSPSAPSGRNRAAPSGRIYTRDEIARLYSAHRQGAYTGREQEWAKQEMDIIRAGAEGRIRNPVDVAGK